jgi:hypothetical protein
MGSCLKSVVQQRCTPSNVSVPKWLNYVRTCDGMQINVTYEDGAATRTTSRKHIVA